MGFCNHCEMKYDGERCPICNRIGLSEQPTEHRESYNRPIKRRGKNAGKYLGILAVIVLALIAIPFGMIFLDFNFLAPILVPEGRDLELNLDERIEFGQEEQTTPEVESEEENIFSNIIPNDFNLLDDGILSYKLDPIPSHIAQTSIVNDGINDGLNSWSEKNTELVFEEITEGTPDIEISWMEYTGEHAGEGCLDCLNYGATIDIVLGQLDCNGKFIQYDKNMITEIVAHEFGHNLGLEHHIDENHLMWSEDNPQIPYDELGYDIPDLILGNFVGYEELENKYELLQEEIQELGKEHDLLTARYELHPEIASTEGEYQRAMFDYNALNLATENYNKKIDESNLLVEEMNCFAGENITYRDDGVIMVVKERID